MQARPCSIALRMGVIMEKVLEQRNAHINRLVEAGDSRAPAWSRQKKSAGLKFKEGEMTEIMNSWRLTSICG